MDNITKAVNHTVTLISREKLSVSGVTDVESFDEALVVLNTSAGVLLIRGAGMSVDKLSIDGGELLVHGHVDGIEYEPERSSGGFLSWLKR